MLVKLSVNNLTESGTRQRSGFVDMDHWCGSVYSGGICGIINGGIGSVDKTVRLAEKVLLERG